MRLIYIALGWVAGILLAASNTSGASVISLYWLGLVGLAIVAAWLSWSEYNWRMATVALVAFTLGGLRFSLVTTSSDIARYNNSGGLTIEGLIVAEPDVRDNRVFLRVEAETVAQAGQTVRTSGLVLLQTPPTIDFHYGDQIAATGLLITPAEYDTFSYADYLARSGVYSIMPNAAVEVLSSNHGSSFFSALFNLKERAHETINRHLPDPQAALLSGILLGDESGIAPELADDFSKVGASHVIAISGFNMVIVSGVIMSLLGRVTRRRGLAVVIGIAVISAYTLLVGANAAVLRAAVMSSLVVIAPLLKRKTYVPASLAFVLIVMSALNPTILWDISFQLSFFATLGLTLFADPLTTRFDALLLRLFPRDMARLVGDFLNGPLIVSIAAQITTLPLIILYFQRLSLVSLVVNLLIIPAQALLLIAGGLATLIGLFIPGVGLIFFWFDLVLLSWTIAVVRLFAKLPFADVEFFVDSRLIALYFFVLLGGALMQATQPRWAVQFINFVRARAVVMTTAVAGFSTFLLMGAVFLSRPDQNLHVWFLNLGHSNAVLVQSPNGAQILVDGGRFPSRLLTALGDRMPFTDREIEVLVITQPDEFEFGALPAVLARYDIGVAITNGQPNVGEAFGALQEQLSVYEMIIASAGYNLDVDDGLRLEILNPQAQPDLGDSLDDNALVLRFTYGDVSFLLTSDLSQEGQTALLESGIWPLATVMQLPKHGGIRSLNDAFLNAVQPQLVVLQSDRANRLGDPNPDTLAKLGDTPILRTDEGGTIHLWTDGSILWAVQEG
jgi:competence protein ComEC